MLESASNCSWMYFQNIAGYVIQLIWVILTDTSIYSIGNVRPTMECTFTMLLKKQSLCDSLKKGEAAYVGYALWVGGNTGSLFCESMKPGITSNHF